MDLRFGHVACGDRIVIFLCLNGHLYFLKAVDTTIGATPGGPLPPAWTIQGGFLRLWRRVAAEPDEVTGLRRLYVCLTRAVTSLVVLHGQPLPDALH